LIALNNLAERISITVSYQVDQLQIFQQPVSPFMSP
jgi:hypothetical protein